MLSSSTADEEEVRDELQSDPLDGINKTVPTLVEWKGSGDKVYVTGTFANWNKKFRLHRKYVSRYFLCFVHPRFDCRSFSYPNRG
jgi:hypothetical protein